MFEWRQSRRHANARLEGPNPPKSVLAMIPRLILTRWHGPTWTQCCEWKYNRETCRCPRRLGIKESPQAGEFGFTQRVVNQLPMAGPELTSKKGLDWMIDQLTLEILHVETAHCDIVCGGVHRRNCAGVSRPAEDGCG